MPSRARQDKIGTFKRPFGRNNFAIRKSAVALSGAEQDKKLFEILKNSLAILDP